MKKRITIFFLLVLTVMILTSCKVIILSQDEKEHFGETETSAAPADPATAPADDSDLKAEEIAVFDDESSLPMQFSISEDGKYVYLLQDFDQTYSKISVGGTATELNVVYDAGDFYIKNMAYGNGFTAWTELTDDAFAVKCYNHAKNETTVIRSGHYDFDTDYQVLEIKAYKDCVYYTYHNNEEDFASIMCYDVPSGSESAYMSADFFMPEKMVSAQYESLDINDGWLLCSERTATGTQDLWMINLDDESNMLAHLNSNVSLVYGASFDAVDNILALYYWDTDSIDHIGTCSESASITDIVDFSKSSIAYRDRIRYIDGSLYYIEQTAAEGTVNNFRFCVVSGNDEASTNYDNAYSYFIADDGSIYLLATDFDASPMTVKLLKVAS